MFAYQIHYDRSDDYIISPWHEFIENWKDFGELVGVSDRIRQCFMLHICMKINL